MQPGDVKYKDQNDDNIINQFDYVPLGYASGYPEIYYSASFGLKYKGFSFSVLFQGVAHQSIHLGTESIYRPLVHNYSISNYYYAHRWTPQTKSTATLPRLTTENNPNNYRSNSIWIASKAYLSLRYVKLAYSLPSSLVKSLHMDDIKIILRGRNMYNWNHIPVGIPEGDGLGSDYPVERFYSLGVNFTF